MRVGLIVSIVGHATVLLWGLVSLPGAEPLGAPPIDAMPVELVDIGELTELKKGSKTAAPSEAPQAATIETKTPDAPPVEDPGNAKAPQDAPPTPETSKVAAVPDAGAPPPEAPEPPQESPAEPEAAPPPPPEPAPSEAQVEETPEPAPSTAPVVAPKTPQKKPAPPKPSKQKPVQTAQANDKSKFNSDKISALLDKQTPSGGGTQTPSGAAALGSDKGTSTTKMTLSELDALRSQIQRCWNPPVGATDGDAIIVKIHMELNPDGSVVGQPEVVNSSAAPFFRAAADSARRAILRCQPYQLPAAKYDTWREVTVNFDPREMFGG